ncbi:MAG: hypothetical protein ABIP94_13585 [Planctomycetota bacterium]
MTPDEPYEGRSFPSEAVWLHLPLAETSEYSISSDFVARTLRALQEESTAAAAEAALNRDLPTAALAAFTAPEPSADFVANTMGMLRQDRRARWRELLARHVAPEPSPEFVARTLTALAAERQTGAREFGAQEFGAGEFGARPFGRGLDRSALRTEPTGASALAPHTGSGWRSPAARRWAWPLLTAAAVTLLWLTFWRPSGVPLELRLAQNEPATFAHAYAATPLPAVLARVADSADPYALPSGSADGVWLVLSRN